MCASQKGSAVTNRILRATKAAAEAVSLGSLLNDHGGDCIVQGRDVSKIRSDAGAHRMGVPSNQGGKACGESSHPVSCQLGVCQASPVKGVTIPM